VGCNRGRHTGERGHQGGGTYTGRWQRASPRVNAVIALLTPVLLAALVVTETFGDDGHLVLDERALGVGVAAVALALRAPVLLAVALAALVTALARLFG
jgi:hypothetical protein